MSREFPKNNPSENIALPTVGRIVLFFDCAHAVAVPAVVVSVVDGALTIDHMTAFTTDGPKGFNDVRHTSEEMSEFTPRWGWMEYQKGQAAKAEQLQSELGKLQASAPSTIDGKR